MNTPATLISTPVHKTIAQSSSIFFLRKPPAQFHTERTKGKVEKQRAKLHRLKVFKGCSSPPKVKATKNDKPGARSCGIPRQAEETEWVRCQFCSVRELYVRLSSS